jgi:hypothetical protein
MRWQGRIQNGVVVFDNDSRTAPLPDGTLVEVTTVRSVARDAPGLVPVSQEQREALLGLIGIWKTAQPPSSESAADE